MEAYISNMFENFSYEKCLTLLLSLTDPINLKQSKFTDYEINIIKNFCSREITWTTYFETICC